MNKTKRNRYPKNWESISQNIKLNRAKEKCEICFLPDKTIIHRGKSGHYRNITEEEINILIHWKSLKKFNHKQSLKLLSLTQIHLSVAHKNHIESDCREENLICLCQRCHLMMDKQNNWQRKFLKSTQTTLL